MTGKDGEILPLSSTPVKILEVRARAGQRIVSCAISKCGRWLAYCDQTSLRLFSLSLVGSFVLDCKGLWDFFTSLNANIVVNNSFYREKTSAFNTVACHFLARLWQWIFLVHIMAFVYHRKTVAEVYPGFLSICAAFNHSFHPLGLQDDADSFNPRVMLTKVRCMPAEVLPAGMLAFSPDGATLVSATCAAGVQIVKVDAVQPQLIDVLQLSTGTV